MKLYRPLKSNYIFQKFADNEPCVKVYTDSFPIIPYQFGGYVDKNTCKMGYVKLYPTLGLKGHNGWDMSCWHGEPLYHSADWAGTMKTEVDRNGGIGVDVISKEPVFSYKGQQVHAKLRYWHLKSVVGWDGKDVREGDLIGYGDTTGVSSGDHLHWGLKPCFKDGSNVDGGNGFYGAIDPAPYFVNMFVLDVVKEKKQILSTMDEIRKAIFNIQMGIKKLWGG